jgi:hypothetical protein
VQSESVAVAKIMGTRWFHDGEWRIFGSKEDAEVPLKSIYHRCL